MKNMNYIYIGLPSEFTIFLIDILSRNQMTSQLLKNFMKKKRNKKSLKKVLKKSKKKKGTKWS